MTPEPPITPSRNAWIYPVRLLYLGSLLSAAALVWQHPGLAAVRWGLAVFYAVPGVLLLFGVWPLRPRALAASSFYAILLLMPLLAELWSEPQVRGAALLSCVLTLAYLATAVACIRRRASP